MPKTNNLTLPYLFRNIGSQPATQENFRGVKPLAVNIIYCPPDVMIRANFRPNSDNPVACVTKWQSIPEKVQRALAGNYDGMMLWEAVIHNYDLHLHFHDTVQHTGSKHAIDGSIVFERCRFLTLELEAESFKGLEPARRLHCEFGDDAAWGSFVDLTELREGQGVRKFVTYPKAKSHTFEKISAH